MGENKMPRTTKKDILVFQTVLLFNWLKLMPWLKNMVLRNLYLYRDIII